MSIIAVTGIPYKWNLESVVKTLAKAIKGHFEALNFKPSRTKLKTCYLRLSEKLDPVRVLTAINKGNFGQKVKFHAHIPQNIPDIPLAAKPRKVPKKLRQKLKIPEEEKPDQVLRLTHMEIMTELQSKYPGLYILSKKTGHELLEEIGRKVLDRLKHIMERGGEPCTSSYNLSKFYRRTHPHFGDFQLVLSTLHAVQDAAGLPRDQLREPELSASPATLYTIDNLPFDKVQQACNKYSDRINKKVSEHVKNLKTEISENDTEEEIARKKVREEIKKMAPYLAVIVKQVITKHFVPEKTAYHKIRIYGEPFLPAKDMMAPFVRRYHPVHIMRSSRMYNMLKLSIPPNQYAAIRAMDGTVVSGAKLVIRSSELPTYKVSPELRAEINAVFGGTDPGDDPMEEDQDWQDEA